MADTIISSNLFYSAFEYIFTTATTPTNLWLTEGTIAATNGYGVIMSIAGLSAQIDGHLRSSSAALSATVAEDVAFYVGANATVTATSDTAVYLGGADTLLRNAGQILSNLDYGVWVQGSNSSVYNSGSIFGDRGGVALLQNFLAPGGPVLVNDGLIQAGSNNQDDGAYGHGVEIYQGNSLVVNSGTISAVWVTGNGIDISASFDTGATRITNLEGGVITSSRSWGINAFQLYNDVGDPIAPGLVKIDNYGHIFGEDGSLRAGAASIDLRNFGTMTGLIDLGNANSSLVNFGLVNGDISDIGALATVRNLGTIAGSVSMGHSETNGSTVINRGQIEGFVELGDVTSGIVNSGNIAGQVFLGNGEFTSYRGLNGTLSDYMTGGLGDNLIILGINDDHVLGQGGNDTIRGGGGSDIIIAGTGRDVLTGGEGADIFQFLLASEIGKSAAARDRITDFVSGSDKLDLGGMGAGGSFIGEAAFSMVARQVRYVASTGLLSGDTDGNGTADWILLLSSRPVLVESDFIF